MECFDLNVVGVGCRAHLAGTGIIGQGKIFLGLPKGFNRLGVYEDMQPLIFETYNDYGDSNPVFNVPIWKHLNEEGHTLVRGFKPRLNEPYLHIYLGDCMDKFDCQEITYEQIQNMD